MSAYDSVNTNIDLRAWQGLEGLNCGPLSVRRVLHFFSLGFVSVTFFADL